MGTTTPVSNECLAYCSKLNLKESNLWCNAKNNNESGCLNSYLLALGSEWLTPCKFETNGRCRSDADNKLECNNLKAQCQSTPTLTTLAPTTSATLPNFFAGMKMT